ncbi:hypothetical protein SO802_020415 [Lithocarpus litseifolius]|uniref:Bacterial Ig-like domain-containing protein n=1 Tax=Lithocarpus litseifolius TaxID=425828 RepID=A0AAW2CEQ2_9ROSI
MDVANGLRKVVAARVACKLLPRSALNLGFSTLWLRIGLDLHGWVARIGLVWFGLTVDFENGLIWVITSIMVYSKMGLLKLPLVALLCSVFSLLSFIALCDASELTVKFLKTPQAFSNLNSTTFVFEVLVGGNGACTNCNITCKLDDGVGSIIASECENGTVLCEGLQDGNHKFEVCPNGSQGVGCSSYNWAVDTVPPTANITASTNFTNALNVSINISFSEPCTGGRGFVCSSVNACNLLVHGDGKVIPNSLQILQPNLQYSVLVNLSSTAQSGRVILVMDKNFCTDSAGNKFERNKNSNFTLRFDRRNMAVNLTTHVPERQLDLNGETILVRATNNCVKLRICLTFLVPVLNTSAEILNSLEPKILYSLPMRQGTLLPLNVSKDDPRHHRRFEFMVAGCISGMAIVTIGIDENSIISRHGTPVSKVDLITFLFDSLRPAPMFITLRSDSLMPDIRISTPPSLGPDVNLTTLLHMRTREHNIPMWIEFKEPVFGFHGSNISIEGGKLESFKPESERKYAVVISAFHDDDTVSVIVPENVAHDAAGNKNLASETLLVRPYSVPIISTVISTLATASFVATSIAAGLLTASTASLSSIGTFSPPFSSVSDPASNLFRMAGHIQVFALSRWLGVPLPVEYYEFSRGMQWSIPYFRLPWETGHTHSSAPANSHSFRSKIHDSGIFPGVQHKVFPKPKRLSSDEYTKLFENSGPDPVSDGWEDFSRTMFWLAIIGGSLILLHALLLAILKFRKQRQSGYGVLAFPRFEIFLVNLAVPSICEASAALIRGGTTSGIVVGTLILVAVFFLLLDLLWFLSTGITFAKRVLYKEDNQVIQVGRGNPRIAQVTLGPGNEGRWTLNRKQNSDCLTMLVPLFEELRGPFLSIIAPNDEAGEGSGSTDLAPPSSAQSMSRSTRPSHIPPKRSSTVATPAVPLTSNTSAHTHGDYQIIAPDDKTEEVEVSRGSVPTHAEASSIQNLFMQLRIYYTLIESVRRVVLGAMGGAYKNTWSSTIPVIILLCITSLQLFFLVLEKPFIKRRVQLVEIISVASEVCLFALFLVLVDKELSPKQESIVGVSMLVLFLMGFLPQIVNQLYALRRQIKNLNTAKSFRTGLRIASLGILLLFISQDSLEKLDCSGDNGPNDIDDQGGEESTKDTGGERDEDTNATERNRNSGRRNKNPKNRNRNRKRSSETTMP